MKRTYIKPLAELMQAETHYMLALSIHQEAASPEAEVLVKEEDELFDFYWEW